METNMTTYASNPALTYTIDQFINMKYTDELTYYNFSIIELVNGIKLLDHNLIEDYLSELESLCVNCELDQDQYKKYKYSPDLLAFDVYGSTQLDFIILMINDMIDPKEFDLKTVKLLYASQLKSFLSEVYNAENDYISYNRSINGLSKY